MRWSVTQPDGKVNNLEEPKHLAILSPRIAPTPLISDSVRFYVESKVYSTYSRINQEIKTKHRATRILDTFFNEPFF